MDCGVFGEGNMRMTRDLIIKIGHSSFLLLEMKKWRIDMIDKLKVMNFLQDFGCARLEHLKIIFEDKNNSFKSILDKKMVSQKGDVFVHNTRVIDNSMLIALDALCKFKGRYSNFYIGYGPVLISFITKDNLKYHIIVADEDNKKGIVKIVNDYPMSLPKADRLILIFPNRSELENIECDIPFLYAIYPGMQIIN